MSIGTETLARGMALRGIRCEAVGCLTGLPANGAMREAESGMSKGMPGPISAQTLLNPMTFAVHEPVGPSVSSIF